MRCYQVFIFLLQCLLIRNKYWQPLVKISQWILLQGHTRNRYALSSQQHQMLLGVCGNCWLPLPRLGKRICCEIMEKPSLSPSDAAHRHSSPLLTRPSSTQLLCSEKAEHPLTRAEPLSGWQRTPYATGRCSVAATYCRRLYTPLTAHKERAAKISHAVIQVYFFLLKILCKYYS